MEQLERLGGGLGLVAGDRDAIASPAQADVPAIGNLTQIFVQRAAKVGQVGVVAIQDDRDRCFAAGRTRHADTPLTDSLVTISPFSVLVMAWVMRTSIIWPIRRGWPTKFTIRLFSVRPDNSLGSRREGFSTRILWVVPSMLWLMASACSLISACRRCSRASFTSLGVSSSRSAAGVPGRRE